MRRTTGRIAGVLGVAAALALGGTTAEAGAAPPVSVPWQRVGANWSLDLWSPTPGGGPGDMVRPVSGRDQLYLVDPGGRKYDLLSLPQRGYPTLTAWAGRRALISVGAKIELANLGTGRLTTLSLPHGVTRPAADTTPAYFFDGPSIAVAIPTSTDGSTPPEDWKLSGDLKHATRIAAPFVGLLTSPDGRTVVSASSRGLELSTAAGRGIRKLATPHGWTCTPTRFLGSATVVVSCTTPRADNTVWTVPVRGGRPTQLAKTPNGRGGDLGDLDAVQTTSGTYVESAGACGLIWLGKVGPDGRNHPVSIPGVDDEMSVFLLGTDGRRVLLNATFACGGGSSLFWWDPVTDTVQTLLGPGDNGGSVVAVRLYGAS